MATGSVLFGIEALALADDTSGNFAPALNLVTSSDATDPQNRHWTMDFNDTQEEQVSFTFRLPADYASGGTFKLAFYMQSATVNECRWGIAIQSVTPGDGDLMDSLDPVDEGGGYTFVDETVPGTAKTLDEASVSPSMDSAAAGDFILVSLVRDADDAGDDATGDASLCGLVFEYTTT